MSASEFYNLKAEKPNGQEYNFDTLKDKVVLVVNTASKCGFTPQYTGLEELHQKYKDRGLVVLGFPCNQFGGQEPGTDDDIDNFCKINHGVSFQLFKKSDVNGDKTNEVFKYLKDKKSQLGLTRIKWNFEKFLVDKQGNVVNRYSSMAKPSDIGNDMVKVLVTGASGLLGRAILDNFSNDGSIQVTGLAYSRSSDKLIKCDLNDEKAIEGVIREQQPDVLIHCAAERRPDVAQNDPAATEKLNVDVSGNLSRLMKNIGGSIIYISTDYVFDGTKPPYTTTDTPNPLNLYGKTKLAGEKAVTQNNDKSVILRVPVLYGRVENTKESAVTILIDAVKEGKAKKMEHYANRFPTNVDNVAIALNALTKNIQKVPQIVHYSSREAYTKYEMACTFAEILGLPSDHLIADTEEPTGDAAVSRPKDCQLSRDSFDKLNLNVDDNLSFKEFFIKFLNYVISVVLSDRPYSDDLVGTWSSGSGGVQTGTGFCTPSEYSFNVPDTTGISYSFTKDGFYEESTYKFNSNASAPQCIQAVLIWQHGTYVINDDNGIDTTPIAEDGRIQVEDPCAASSNVLTTANITRNFQSFLPFDDPVKDKKALQLYDFDGSITNGNRKRDVNSDMEEILEERFLEKRAGGGGRASGESSELRDCATRDDMVKQELDILPGTDIRMVSCSPFELRCDKKPPVSFVGGNIRSQDSSYPLATFSQTKSGIFKKSTGTADLTIYNMSAVAPAVCFILIIASKAYQACVWNKNLDDLAKQHDLTQYDRAQGMIFSSAGAAGAV
ncbi:methionine adenosyltransferase II, beta [Wallemia mellicola]|uniref:Glutathione peroxidase n=2 Tax=Wallemia mellicola TaxID=1708541 RepID=A0A4T0MAL9_9BASI|nr:methionine adenosyltransferase II, beta [Wallemia mellicola]